MRARRVAAALAVLGTLATGCSGQAQHQLDEAGKLISGAGTCAKVAKIAAGKAADLERNRNDPQKLQATLRSAAGQLRAEAAGVHDPRLKAAIRSFVADLRTDAARARQGGSVDTGAIQSDAARLAHACT